jgi:hypothetical protein
MKTPPQPPPTALSPVPKDSPSHKLPYIPPYVVQLTSAPTTSGRKINIAAGEGLYTYTPPYSPS